MIPLQVIINNQGYRDKTEISIETLYRHLLNKDDIKTSLPMYEDIEPLFKTYAKNQTDFIFFSFSKALSGTHNFASILVHELKDSYTTKMAVIDLKNGGLASAMILEKVLEKLEENASFEEVILYSQSLIDQMHHVVVINDLTQLKKGGRISALKSLISGVLSIKPVLILEQGAIKSYKNAIGLKRALNEQILYLDKFAISKDQEIGINYSYNETLLQDMEKLLQKAGYTHTRRGKIASVMTAHIGLDAVSLCFLGK